ncbi:MAG TPA: chaperone modulator CbpM, partial [Candidatus Babeliales bacterium]|nr:chaperone modulator CbpM [Candidatus Babeliales bacterium]
RLFSAQDIKRLEEIIYLTHQLGVNLAGVELILRLQNQIKKLQREMNKAFAETQTQLNQEVELSKSSLKNSAEQLAKLKKRALTKKVDSLPEAIKYDEQ